MQRPVMNPTYLEPVEAPKPKKRIFRASAKLLWQALTFNVWRVLPGYRQRPHEDSLAARLVRWMLIRCALAIIAVVALAGGLVYCGTHPSTYASGADPASAGLYFENVKITTPDGLVSEAWLVPVLDAQMVLRQKDYALGRECPAAILLHDFGQTREQMLPLIKPLHEAGLVVLVPAMRSSAGGPAAGHTFGIRESKDVLAAVDLLKRRAYVDARRMTLIGAGTGATAALLAGSQDPVVKAVVVRQPVESGDALLEFIGPRDDRLRWLGAVCRWTFQLCYFVDAEEIDAERQMREQGADLLALKPSDHLDGWVGQKTAAMICEYLVQRLDGPMPAVADIKSE